MENFTGLELAFMGMIALFIITNLITGYLWIHEDVVGTANIRGYQSNEVIARDTIGAQTQRIISLNTRNDRRAETISDLKSQTGKLCEQISDLRSQNGKLCEQISDMKQLEDCIDVVAEIINYCSSQEGKKTAAKYLKPINDILQAWNDNE